MGSRAPQVETGVDRHFVVDEEGRALRATWRPDRGFVNVSIWRDRSCVETFHLTPGEAGHLVSYLAGVLSAAVTPASASPVGVGVDEPPSGVSPVAVVRRTVANLLDEAASRLRG